MNIRQHALDMVARLDRLVELEPSRPQLCLQDLDPDDFNENERAIIALLACSHNAIEMLTAGYEEIVRYLAQLAPATGLH